MISQAPEASELPYAAAPELLAEWDECQAFAQRAVLARLGGMRASDALLEYAGKLRLYFRAAFLLSAWAPSARLRRDLTCRLAMHIVAMKLLDDLVDEDSGLNRFELGGGSLLLLLAAARDLSQYRAGSAIADVLSENFDQVCRTQLECKRVPACTLDSWLHYARDYGARFLATYGEIGGLGAGLDADLAQIPREFGSAFGLIITIADDLTDYTRHGEREGNLGALLVDGIVDAAEIQRIIEEQKDLAESALRRLPAAHDLVPVARMFASDVIDRILPTFAGRTEAPRVKAS